MPATVYDKCPVVQAVATPESCTGNDGTITAGGFKGTQPYQFSIDGVNFQANNVFTGLKAGTYTVTIRDAFGFTSTTPCIVPNNCLNISFTTINSTCGSSNGSIMMSVSNGQSPYQYSLDGVNYQNSNVFTSLLSGSYTVYVKDASGAKGSINVSVLNTPGAFLSLSATAATCADNDGSVSAANLGGTAPFMYSADGISYQSNSSFSNLDTGNKLFYIKDANGCIDSQTVTVPLTNNLTVAAGASPTICQGAQIKLNATSNGQSFTWSPTSGLNDAGILNPLASPSNTAKYYLTAVLGICTKEDSVIVSVNPAPVADAGSDTAICYGKSTELSGSGGSLYQWSPATFLSDEKIADPVVDHPTATITYQLSVTDANGCTSLQSAPVTVTVTPPAKVFAGNDTSILINQTLPLNAMDVNNSGFISYSWSPSSGLNNAGIENPIALITKDILYTVVASTAEGCQGTDSISIKAFAVADIFVPTAFTPNHDGHNDVLRVILIGMKELKSFVVFNRWGQQLFISKDPGKGWDGTVNGVLQDAGTYVWMVQGIDFGGRSVQRKGTVILIR